MPKFQKLTPINDAEIGIYRDALDYVFENDDLRNVAVSGAYSAGKSSVLESYKDKHSDKKFLHISLAHFEDANANQPTQTEKQDDDKQNEKKNTEKKQDAVKETVLEGKILNQLIHQISPNRIPQANFRIKQKVEPNKVAWWTVAATVFALSLFHVIFFSGWQSYVKSIFTDWIRVPLDLTTRNSSVLLTGAICVVLASILLYKIIKVQINKGLFKKISADKLEIEIFENSDDSYFDKYLNEVLYLLDQCEADVIVFEDMDRYNVNRIFERLREVNNLIKIQRSKKNDAKPLRFFYLLRDDIFVSKDRTKFFDFIIPIVPVVDGSNSYDQFIMHLSESGALGLFDEPFLQGLSLYIDDMRILKNICNEFLIYNSRLNITELNPNKLMAIVAYKNLFPRDFIELQLGSGFVFTLFDKKEQFVSVKIARLETELTVANERLEAAKKEHLTSERELIVAIADRRQEIENKYRSRYYQMQEKQNELQQLTEEEAYRKQAIEDNNNVLLPKLQTNIIRIENLIVKVKSESLCEIITRENIDEIFSVTSENDIGIVSDFRTVRGNTYIDLLKYLIRNGYIDETYADYMTYFYEHSLSRTDKIFLRSVADQRMKVADYQLKEPEKVFARLNMSDFNQPEILNYDLLFYLLEKSASNYIDEGKSVRRETSFPVFFTAPLTKSKERQCLNVMLAQMLDTSWNHFIQSVFSSIKDNRLNYLVNFLNTVRKEYLTSILLNKTEFAGSCRDNFVFRTLVATPVEETIYDDNFKKALLGFVSDHPMFLDKERFEDTKLKEMFNIDTFMLFLLNSHFLENLEKIGIRFSMIDYDKAQHNLFEWVYNKHLYKLTFDNIAHLLKVKYELSESDDFKHKNYTLVNTMPDSPLTKYIEDNINDYIAEILAVCDGEITDDENKALDIINNKHISEKHKKSYIDSLVATIQKITDVEDEKLWIYLLYANCVAHTEQNILDYFCICEHQITQELIQFIDSQDNEYDYTDVKKEYEKDIQSKYFVAVLQCNEISNFHYRQILKTLNRAYNNDFSVEGISDEKILILIEIDVIPMDTDSLLFMREHYPKAIMPYIEKHITKYVDEILDEENFDLSEALEVLSSSVSDKHKLALLAKIKDDITARKFEYSDAVKSHILSNNLNENDIHHFICSYQSEGTLTKQAIEKITLDHIDTIFDSENNINKSLVDKLLDSSTISQANKQKLFALLLPYLDEAQCKHYMGRLGLQAFLSLFEQKRPLIRINEINARILLIFKNKGWITKFEKAEKEQGFYRAFGRKEHTDKKRKK